MCGAPRLCVGAAALQSSVLRPCLGLCSLCQVYRSREGVAALPGPVPILYLWLFVAFLGMCSGYLIRGERQGEWCVSVWCGCVFYCIFVRRVLQCIVYVRLSMTGMDRKVGGAGAVCPLYSVDPYHVVRAVYVVQCVLCGVDLF